MAVVRTACPGSGLQAYRPYRVASCVDVAAGDSFETVRSVDGARTVRSLHHFLADSEAAHRRANFGRLLHILVLLRARVEGAPHDVVIVESASTLGTPVLDLILDHSIDRVCCVQCRCLRHPVDLSALHASHGLRTPSLNQVFEDASAWKRCVLLDPIVVILIEVWVPHALLAHLRLSLRVDRRSREFLKDSP